MAHEVEFGSTAISKFSTKICEAEKDTVFEWDFIFNAISKKPEETVKTRNQEP